MQSVESTHRQSKSAEQLLISESERSDAGASSASPRPKSGVPDLTELGQSQKQRDHSFETAGETNGRERSQVTSAGVLSDASSFVWDSADDVLGVKASVSSTAPHFVEVESLDYEQIVNSYSRADLRSANSDRAKHKWKEKLAKGRTVSRWYETVCQT
jgi:hypothetical protein